MEFDGFIQQEHGKKQEPEIEPKQEQSNQHNESAITHLQNNNYFRLFDPFAHLNNNNENNNDIDLNMNMNMNMNMSTNIMPFSPLMTPSTTHAQIGHCCRN